MNTAAPRQRGIEDADVLYAIATFEGWLRTADAAVVGVLVDAGEPRWNSATGAAWQQGDPSSVVTPVRFQELRVRVERDVKGDAVEGEEMMFLLHEMPTGPRSFLSASQEGERVFITAIAGTVMFEDGQEKTYEKTAEGASYVELNPQTAVRFFAKQERGAADHRALAEAVSAGRAVPPQDAAPLDDLVQRARAIDTVLPQQELGYSEN